MLDMQLPPPAASAQDPPAQLLQPSLVPSDPGSLPRLRDAAVTPVCRFNRSEAECASQRHTQARRPLTWLATDKALPSTAAVYRIHVNVNTDSRVPPLLFGWQRQKITGAGTHSALQILKRTHICRFLKCQRSPSVCTAPLPRFWALLPVSQVPYSPAGPA